MIKCWRTNQRVSLQKCRDMKERLLSQQRETQASLERLRALIRLIQRDHMIQVTMTATTTTSGGAALLSLPWIKPCSTSSTSSSTAPPAGPSTLLHKSVLHSQGNNWANHRQKETLLITTYVHFFYHTAPPELHERCSQWKLEIEIWSVWVPPAQELYCLKVKNILKNYKEKKNQILTTVYS